MVIITKDKKRWKDDFYPTPIPLCDKIFEHVVAEIPFGARVLDPGCGDGNFGKSIKQYFPQCYLVGVDIVDRLSASDNRKYYEEYYTIDYTRPDQVGAIFQHEKDRFKLVVGNPPFKHAEKFVRMSHAISDGQIVFLLKLAFLEGQERAHSFWPIFKLKTLYVLDARVSWDGSGKSNDQAHAVYEWSSSPKTSGYDYPIIRWLRWK